MSSISEKLAAKKAPESEIKTGMQSSVEVSQPPANPPAPPDEEPDSSLYKDYPENSYLMKRQKFLILANGGKKKPDVHGVITATNEAEIAVLDYLVARNQNLVIKVK